MINQISLYTMTGFYVLAGINHFVNPKWYLRIIPAWIPFPNLTNYLSGLCEIVFALMLLPDSTRNPGAWLLIALLIAVFPANVQMCINYYVYKNPYFWLTVLRLPMQLLLIWWAWQFTK